MAQNNNNGRKEIEKVFDRYSELYADLISRHSHLTDKQRLSVIKKFELGFQISNYFYLYKDELLQTDMLFIATKQVLNDLEEVNKKYNVKKKK